MVRNSTSKRTMVRYKQWCLSLVVYTTRAAAKMRAAGRELPLTGPVAISWACFHPRPDSKQRKTIPSPLWVSVKPDRDNSDKPILDACTKAQILEDDGRVSAGLLLQLYIHRDREPGALVTLSELGPPDGFATLETHLAHFLSMAKGVPRE